MAYILRRSETFPRFFYNGRICLTNNAAERALRGIALGRKAWLFAGFDRGTPRMLTLRPQVFDQMPVSVRPFGTGDFRIILPWQNDGTNSPVPEIFTEFMRGISTITDDMGRWVRNTRMAVHVPVRAKA